MCEQNSLPVLSDGLIYIYVYLFIIAGNFWKEGPFRLWFFSLSAMDTVGEAEDERSRAVMRGERERE